MKIRRVLVYAIIAGIFVLLSQWLVRRTPGALEYYASYVSYPFLKMHNVASSAFESMALKKRDAAALEALCAQLKFERDQLLSETIALKTVISYAEDVHELMEYKKNLSCEHTIISHIIARQFTNQAHEFFIDAGTCQGIEADMVAVYLQFLVGRVVEVYPQYSKVIAITDKRCKVSAFCADTKAAGMHEGANSAKKTHLTRVSHLSTLKKGDLVISSGEGLIFPRGFGLGRIVDYTLEDELMYAIAVEPCINVNELKYCCIIPKGRSCSGPLEKSEESHKNGDSEGVANSLR